MRIEMLDLDGCGPRRTRVCAVPRRRDGEYWPAVTDVPCPIATCGGQVRWAEAGYVPGYRICDRCGRHWLAAGNAEWPALIRVGSRRSRV